MRLDCLSTKDDSLNELRLTKELDVMQSKLSNFLRGIPQQERLLQSFLHYTQTQTMVVEPLSSETH